MIYRYPFFPSHLVPVLWVRDSPVSGPLYISFRISLHRVLICGK
jgi:hypothetical protein